MGVFSGAGPSGFLVSLLTESFAVRALLGSLVAAAVAAIALRAGWVQTPGARGWAVRLPMFTAAFAAVATVVGGGVSAEHYIPRVWATVPAVASGEGLELLGEVRVLTADSGIDGVALTWGLIATVLLLRRIVGFRKMRRLLDRASPVPAEDPLWITVERIRMVLGAPPVRVRRLEGCPGGAFAMGLVRPVVVFDGALLDLLDPHEVEGLVAHELAHVVSRHPLISAMTGIVSDLAFFLPALSRGRRWLAREQEHVADSIAAQCTRRPGALASSILKVWRCSGQTIKGMPACAAVPVLAGRGPAASARLSPTASAVAMRIERLLDAASISAVRRLGEAALVACAFVLAAAATIALPAWISSTLEIPRVALSVMPAPEPATESPAFGTFRSLSNPWMYWQEMGAAERRFSRLGRASSSACPCPDQLLRRAAVAASTPGAQRMAWRAPAGSYDVVPPARAARPLWTVDPAHGVGLFALPDGERRAGARDPLE